MARWGTSKKTTAEQLIAELRNLQAILVDVINQKTELKNKITSNIAMINEGKIRITNRPGDIEKTNKNINAPLSVAYDLNIQELNQIQRAMELGSKVRDLEPILAFDNGRGGQISDRIAKEVDEADELRATINTIIALLEQKKDKP